MASPQLAAVHSSPHPTPENLGPVHIKVRWVRVIAALALVGIGAYFLTANLTADTPSPQESSKQVPADRAVAPVKAVKPAVSKPAAKSGKAAAPKAGKTTMPAGRPSKPAAATPATPPATVAGRGAAPSRGSTVANQRGASGEQLPFTGLPVWVAVLMGCMLIGGGIWVQLNALQIGTAASGYRRGPALRPLETYRQLLGK